ncbi:hypothetical protein [Bacillus toyonensis]|uniref:hypothetical protein n=1 Tax=Bacillus toyonensis TaxID=155322 RepID=UPI002E250826|nr:hypothetical protein [Bacillus toyonensis]
MINFDDYGIEVISRCSRSAKFRDNANELEYSYVESIGSTISVHIYKEGHKIIDLCEQDLKSLHSKKDDGVLIEDLSIEREVIVKAIVDYEKEKQGLVFVNKLFLRDLYQLSQRYIRSEAEPNQFIVIMNAQLLHLINKKMPTVIQTAYKNDLLLLINETSIVEVENAFTLLPVKNWVLNNYEIEELSENIRHIFV